MLATSSVLVVAGACTFTVGVADLQNGDCGAGEKACPDSNRVMHCVGFDQPQYGCRQPGCAPCSLPYATSRCDPGNNCAVAVCMPGYAHCDNVPSHGCETNIFADPKNCGQDQSACFNQCDTEVNGQPTVLSTACINGVCQIGGCQHGFQDCDKVITNGCECASPRVCDPTTGGCVAPSDGGTD